jgi:hypothetical protein
LISDGEPGACGGSVMSNAAVATDAYQGTPSIGTYVIGLGGGAVLDPIALAGSGQSMHAMPATLNPAMEILGAMNQIASVVTCHYGLPIGADPKLANIEIELGGGLPTKIGKVEGAANCGSLGGWYFDDLSAPTKVLLCPQTCDPLKGTPGSRVSLLLGCW